LKEDLLPYYENELSFIRNLGKEFAADWGKIAERLALEPGKCEDPHVERLIEAFALIAGRIHHKIDDEFPQITESLLNILYPHYLRPIPSMSIAQFHIDPEQGALTSGHTVKKDATLFSGSVAGKSISCQFRTCYPVTLWPIEITGAAVMPAASVQGPGTDKAVAVVRLDVRCLAGTRLSTLAVDKLRFFLSGESQIAHALYELLFCNVQGVSLRSTGRHSVTVNLPDGAVQPVGFGRDEGMLPYPDRSFLGYRLIQEYFAFPWKYLFFDLAGFDKIDRSQFGDSFQILFFLNPFERRERLQILEQNVNRQTFQLGCTPIVNLFERPAEPIRLTHATSEYRVIPDVHKQPFMEVYSVDRVMSTAPYFEAPHVYEPFYSVRHAYENEPSQAFWYATRRLSERKGDSGTEIYLSLVDLGFNPALPPVETLTVHVTCTNRDLAGQLPFSGEFGELSVESGPLIRARSIIAPTKTVRPPLRRSLQWRLISHLALNYLSLTDGGLNALQEILKLYDFADNPSIQRQITGIVAVSSEPRLRRIVSEHGIVFAQGIRTRIEFDENGFLGSGVFLFAAVLERFLGLYTAINSFTQLSAVTRQRKGELKPWPPRSGEQILL
jgi:type VI secretion system protein ImpG